MRTPLASEERAEALAAYLVEKARNYQKEHLYKFVGAGLSRQAVQMSPKLPAKLWLELDIVPLVFETGLEYPYPQKNPHSSISVDEEADSMARKCLM
jgi:hypothetical protein